jgi:hypothetical protein
VWESCSEQRTDPLRHRGRLEHTHNRVHNYPPRWNAAPSQSLLVIRRNHQTGEVSLDLALGSYSLWCWDSKLGRKADKR